MESNKIKVGVITTVHDPNDTRIYHRQIQTLIINGYKVFYFCKEAPKTHSEATIILLPQFNNAYLRILISPIVALYKTLREKQIKVYHLHDPELIFVGLILKWFGKTIIYDAHEDLPSQILTKNWIPIFFRKPFSKLANWIENSFLRSLDAVITVTEPLVERFINARLNRVTLVRNYPLMNELVFEKTLDKSIDVIYVGEASVPRGLKLMIEAFLQSKYAQSFVIIGRMNPINFLESYSTHPKYHGIKYLGPKTRKEVAKYLAQSKIGLVPLLDTPNNRIGYPTKLFEYMSVSLPSIATKLPLIQEIRNSAQAFLLVEPNHISDMADSIDLLLTNPMLRIELAQNGRKAIESIFSWENEESKLLNLYAELTHTKKS
jgi:glycosyltransferase involved in cell wall biosynthesis